MLSSPTAVLTSEQDNQLITVNNKKIIQFAYSETHTKFGMQGNGQENSVSKQHGQQYRKMLKYRFPQTAT